MTVDAPATLVVRVTMNNRLRRAAFGSIALHLVWCVALIVWAVLLVLSDPGSPALLVIGAILVGWSGWGLWRLVPHARTRHQMLSLGLPTLQLDEVGVRVRDVTMNLDGASLPWADCAAVVVSAAPRRTEWPVQPVRYVQFLPVAEDRVETHREVWRSDVRAEILEVPAAEGLLTWLELPGSSPDAHDVAAWLRAHQPQLRLVGAGHSVSDE
ncbi:hypothetical protein [Nocardioides sp.]|uniref:hypothetical protein n=1 Tax=Nocardioides sp. TaxID=35761 RepID=UPI002B9163EF|nr:hypothetical protein [Nocardioides sp.]HXH78165.1 hypothetical protein [Nocardioides sp.]